jgi:large subunit ribosomal protein L35Ae
MEGIVNNYRRNRSSTKCNHIIITVDHSTSRDEATKLVGKKVTFTTRTGKKIEGEVRAPHGNKGAVRAIFERGLPGQALGTKVEVA